MSVLIVSFRFNRLAFDAVDKMDVELEVEGIAIFRAFNLEAGLAIEHVPKFAEEAQGVLGVGKDLVHNFDEAFRVFSQLLLQCCEQRLRLGSSTRVGTVAPLPGRTQVF